jgi:NTP pyrophosphatase (non-canonical NTP hydrolase)
LLAGGVILFNCDSPIVDDNRKLRVLTEELGEVADAIDRLERLGKTDIGFFKSLSMQKRAAIKTAREHLRAELKQVAAVAVAWLETPEVGS